MGSVNERPKIHAHRALPQTGLGPLNRPSAGGAGPCCARDRYLVPTGGILIYGGAVSQGIGVVWSADHLESDGETDWSILGTQIKTALTFVEPEIDPFVFSLKRPFVWIKITQIDLEEPKTSRAFKLLASIGIEAETGTLSGKRQYLVSTMAVVPVIAGNLVTPLREFNAEVDLALCAIPTGRWRGGLRAVFMTLVLVLSAFMGLCGRD